MNQEEKHDCERWAEEGSGCSICSQTHKILTVDEIKEVQERINWRINELSHFAQELKEKVEGMKAKKDGIPPRYEVSDIGNSYWEGHTAAIDDFLTLLDTNK